jgi:sec-independent protein translocase protein TatB
MFDVGFAEIFLLALIGLLVLGPERLPGVARTVGGFVRKARASWVSLRRTIESELAEADLSTPIKKASEEIKQIGRELTETPSFKSKNLESETTVPDPSIEDISEPVPSQEPGSGKSENV